MKNAKHEVVSSGVKIDVTYQKDKYKLSYLYLKTISAKRLTFFQDDLNLSIILLTVLGIVVINVKDQNRVINKKI